jgi:hypothetical protein
MLRPLLIVVFLIAGAAWAYKVERVCEIVTSKQGSKEVCKTVLVKQPEKKAEEPKSSRH